MKKLLSLVTIPLLLLSPESHGSDYVQFIRQVQMPDELEWDMSAALSSLEQVILRDHVDTCVTHALTGDDVALRKERVEELVAVLGGTKK